MRARDSVRLIGRRFSELEAIEDAVLRERAEDDRLNERQRAQGRLGCDKRPEGWLQEGEVCHAQHVADVAEKKGRRARCTRLAQPCQ